MEDFIGQLSLTDAELARLVGLAVVLLLGLFFLRTAFKLTATLFRIGCFGIIFIVAAVYLLSLFG